MSAASTYTCTFCGRTSDGAALSCTGCGAPVDVESVVAPSGWREMPGIRDMARLEFGRSSCQIEGLYVPVADFNLAAGDSVYFAHHVLLWKDPQVEISAMPLDGGWTRMLAGMPLVMTQAAGPGHVAFSQDAPGEMVAIPLEANQAVDVREHVLVAATGNVRYSYFATNVWVGSGQETEFPLGQMMDRFTAGGTPGLVLLHGAGNIFLRRLGDDENILVKPGALFYKDPTVQMHMHFEQTPVLGQPPSKSPSTYVRAEGWLRLYGPGRVAIQSAFEPGEESAGFQGRLHSPATWSRASTDSEGRFIRPGPWHYEQGGETRGPASLAHLKGLALIGRLPADTPVRGESVAEWTPVGRIAYCTTCRAEVPLASKDFWGQQGWFSRVMFFILCFPIALALAIASLYTKVTVSVCSRCGGSMSADTLATTTTTTIAPMASRSLRDAMNKR